MTPTEFSRPTLSRSPLAVAISLVLGAATPALVHAQESTSDDASTVLAAAADAPASAASRQNRRRGGTLEEVTVEGQKYRSEVSSPKYTTELVDVPQTLVVIRRTCFASRPQ